MKSKHLLLILSQVILVSLLTVEHISCEHTPTVFVLDTSDSDSPVSSSGNQYGDSSSNKSSQDESGKNTEIVTDEITASPKRTQNNGTGSKSANDQNEVKQTNHQRHQQPKTTLTEADDHQQASKQQNAPKDKQHSEHDHDHESHPAEHPQDGTQNDEATASRHRESSASRRSLDTESQLAPARDKATNSGSNGQQPHHPGPHHEPPPPPPPPHHHQHDHPPHHHDHPPHHNDQREQAPHPPSNQNQKPKSGITTTSTTTNSYDQDQVPKTEERLLISITSDEDGSYQKPPKSGGYNEEPGPHQQQPHHHQKRKPTFTISIQDPNAANKQNGGNGHQAVILRPTEDGIVIATLGSPNSNNKKPSGGGGGILSGLIGAVSGSINQPPLTGNSGNNNNNNEPYQEPANNPIRPISTTRSPHISEPYSSNNNNNQPISSTLLGGSRPQQPWTDERPQKPTFDESAISETTRRPTSRPTYQDTSSSSSNQQHDYDNNNNNGGVAEQLGPKYPLNEKSCGIMHETRIVGGDEADPDDFMWMAAIIKSKPRDGEPRPFCGGSLITRRHILTAAHCLEGLAPRDVLVRLGGYDFEDSASSSSADFAIDQFRVPAQYSKKTHVADIAIMRLKTPLQPNDNYKTVCMPQPRRSYVGALGTVTGYGSQSQTFRRAAPKLRQVTVPIWENRKCAAVYKKNLTESFMCAGYEEGGKDACQGDSGGPLMTEGPEQKMMIVGVVSHGIGCGAPGYPGVYTRTSTFADWIEKNTKE